MANIETYKRDFLLALLRDMVRIRQFENIAAQMYRQRKIGGFCHLYDGQEAVAVGSIAALDMTKDYVLTSYRDHGHAMACGMSAKSIMSELFGKIDGCSRGKGGSMHLFDAERHMFGGNGIVGAQIPVASGVAFAAKYRKSDGVVLCYLGDGAVHQGAFHETMNLASIWKLPMVFIVENNQYGMGTSVERVSGVRDFDIKAKGYGLKGKAVNGMSVLTVYEEIKKVVKLARKGEPILLDVKTYRYKGHSMSDPGKYRTREDLQRHKEEDPILLLKTAMIAAKMLTDKEYEKIHEEAELEANKAVEFADASPEPALETMYEDIYA